MTGRYMGILFQYKSGFKRPRTKTSHFAFLALKKKNSVNFKTTQEESSIPRHSTSCLNVKRSYLVTQYCSASPKKFRKIRTTTTITTAAAPTTTTATTSPAPPTPAAAAAPPTPAAAAAPPPPPPPPPSLPSPLLLPPPPSPPEDTGSKAL